MTNPQGPAVSSGAGTPRLGVTFPFPGLPLLTHRDLVRQMVDLGYDAVWAGESNGLDALSPLIAAAAWAPELRVGSAIVPVQTRGPALMAMTAAALAEMAPGRSSLGIGVSSPVVVSDWNARTYDQPRARIEEMIRFLRASFTGRSVSEHYETFDVANFRLSRPVVSPPQLMVAALRPRMLELAADQADGAITTTVASSDIPTLRRHLKHRTRLVVWVTVCPSADGDAVRAAIRPAMAAYLCVPAYERQQRWLGRADRLNPMWDAWAQGRYREAIAALPDSVIDELAVHGTPQECRERVARYFEAGATDVVLCFDPTVVAPPDALRMLAPGGSPP